MNNYYYQFDSTFKEISDLRLHGKYLVHAKISLLKDFFAYMMCEKMKKANVTIYSDVSGKAEPFTAENPATIKLELEKLSDEHVLHWAVLQDIFQTADTCLSELELSNLDGKPRILIKQSPSEMVDFIKKLNLILAPENISLKLGYDCANIKHDDYKIIFKAMVTNTGNTCNLPETIRKNIEEIDACVERPVRLVVDYVCMVDGTVKSEEIIECETTLLSLEREDRAILPKMFKTCFVSDTMFSSTQFFCETNFLGKNIFVHIQSYVKKGEEQAAMSRVLSFVGRVKNFFMTRKDWAYTKSREEYLTSYADCRNINVILKTDYDVDVFVTQLLIKDEMIKYYAKAFEVALGDDCESVEVIASTIVCRTNGNHLSDGRFVFDLPYMRKNLEESVKLLVEMDKNDEMMVEEMYQIVPYDHSGYNVLVTLPVTAKVYFENLRHILNTMIQSRYGNEVFRFKKSVHFMDVLVAHRHAVNAIYNFLCSDITCYVIMPDQSIPVMASVPNFDMDEFIKELKKACLQVDFIKQIEKKLIPRECWSYPSEPVVGIVCSSNDYDQLNIINTCIEVVNKKMRKNRTYRALIHFKNTLNQSIEVFTCEIGEMDQEQAKEFIGYFETLICVEDFSVNITLEDHVYFIELESNHHCASILSLSTIPKTIHRIMNFFKEGSDKTLECAKKQFESNYKDCELVNVYVQDKQSGIVYLCNSIFLNKEGYIKYFNRAFKEMSEERNINEFYRDIIVSGHSVGDSGIVKFIDYEGSFCDGEQLANYAKDTQDLIVRHVKAGAAILYARRINIYVQCFPNMDQALHAEFRNPSGCPNVQLDIIPEFGCFADIVVQLEDWIAQKEDVYHVGQKSYQSRTDGPDLLFYNLWSDTTMPKQVERVFEQHIFNFMNLLELKSVTEKEMAKFTYNFYDAGTSGNVCVHASIVLRDGKKYLFIDETAPETNKGSMKDYVKSYFDTKEDSIRIFEVPKFVIDLIKENIPEITID